MKTPRQVHGGRRARGCALRRGLPRHATTRSTAGIRASRSTSAARRWPHRPTSRSPSSIATTSTGATHERYTTFPNTYHHHQQADEALGTSQHIPLGISQHIRVTRPPHRILLPSCLELAPARRQPRCGDSRFTRARRQAVVLPFSLRSLSSHSVRRRDCPVPYTFHAMYRTESLMLRTASRTASSSCCSRR